MLTIDAAWAVGIALAVIRAGAFAAASPILAKVMPRMARGAFAIAEGYGYTYKNAERGYLYYKMNPDKPNACRNEWSVIFAISAASLRLAACHTIALIAVRRRRSVPSVPTASSFCSGMALDCCW